MSQTSSSSLLALIAGDFYLRRKNLMVSIPTTYRTTCMLTFLILTTGRAHTTNYRGPWRWVMSWRSISEPFTATRRVVMPTRPTDDPLLFASLVKTCVTHKDLEKNPRHFLK